MKSRVFWLLAVSLLLAIGAPGARGFGAAAALHLSSGDFIEGELCGGAEAGVLRWQGSAFASPLDFPLGAVSAVSFPARGPRPRPDSPYCLELDGGDVLFGDLAMLSDKEIQFTAPGLGLLHIQRSAVQRLLHSRKSADLIYLGPNGLLEWKASPAGAWEQDAGRLATVRDGASLVGDLGLPKQACIDFDLSWTSKPDFTWELGASAKAAQAVQAPHQPMRLRVLGPAGPSRDEPVFRLEVLDGELVLLGETAQKADLASLVKIAPGAGHCHFQVYLDQEHNRAIVFGADGKLLADMTIADSPATSGSCLRLINHRGNVRLEQLGITRWDGRPPRAVQGDKSRLQRTDGSVLNGEIEGFDAAKKEFLIAEGGRHSRVPADAVNSIVLPAPGGPSTFLAAFDVRAICENGVRLSGNLQKVEVGRLWLSRPGIAERLAIELSLLHSLVVLEDRKPLPEPVGRSGRLEGDGMKLEGCLAEAARMPGASRLAWRPRGSSTASPLKQDFAGRIVYRELSPPSQQMPQMNQVAQMQVRAAAPAAAFGVMGAVVNVLGGSPSRPSRPSSSSWKGPAMFLRTGDTIACEVKRIDEKGVAFHSPQFDATFVPNDKVKAVELENRSVATKIDIAKRDRLLTLPRMQKEDPPTHLIRSIEGDYLRGRLVDMDDKTLTVEVRGDPRRVDREQVASIIWLDVNGKKDKADAPKEAAGHNEPTDKPATDAKPSPEARVRSLRLPAAGGKPAADAKPSLDGRVQSLRRDGVRLTFRPEKLSGAILQGTSDVLGACRVELSEVDQLIIGRAIEQQAQALPYQRWTLQPAIEPKFAQANAGGGMESELVGKPAPNFELETLDGPRFRLSDQRNKIVVVDFWATWCGPCRQTLPELVRAADKYRDRNVVLLTVNLQETPEAIKSMMTLSGLKMPVGLDHNGAVAEKYAAVAIPQTVIIDGKGNVARLFVGGGSNYFNDITGALEALLNPAAEQAKPQ